MAGLIPTAMCQVGSGTLSDKGVTMDWEEENGFLTRNIDGIRCSITYDELSEKYLTTACIYFYAANSSNTEDAAKKKATVLVEELKDAVKNEFK